MWIVFECGDCQIDQDSVWHGQGREELVAALRAAGDAELADKIASLDGLAPGFWRLDHLAGERATFLIVTGERFEVGPLF